MAPEPPGGSAPRGKILQFRERSNRRIRVLVLDEEPSLRQLVRAMLVMDQRPAFEVFEAASVEEAITLILQPASRPDVLLVDLMLGRAFRVDAIREIRERGKAPSLPIGILSGRGNPDDLLRARMAGADAFLAKPFTGRDLVLMAARLGGEPLSSRDDLSLLGYPGQT